MKRITILGGILIIWLCASFPVCAQETFTLTTYFPAPYGTYSMMRLFPRNDFLGGAACDRPGEMRFHSGDNIAYFCSGQTLTWLPLGAGLWIDSSQHCLCAQPINTTWDVGIGTSNAEATLDVRGESLVVRHSSSALPSPMDFFFETSAATSFNRTLELKDGSDPSSWKLIRPAGGYQEFYIEHGGVTVADFGRVKERCVEPSNTRGGIGIGGPCAADNCAVWVQVYGKFRANNVFAQTLRVTPPTSSGTFSTTATFPAGNFSQIPAVLCSAGPDLRGPSASNPYIPVMCSVSNITTNSATITIGTNRGDVDFDGLPKYIDVIAWKY